MNQHTAIPWRERIVVRADDCWEWNGAHTRSGYARVTIGGKDQRVHRLTYEDRYGSIPHGRVLDHFFCDNKWCVNPEHVRPVTQRENILRSKKYVLVTPSMRCPKGHDLNVELGVRPDGGPRCKACMRDHQRRYLLRKSHA